MLLKDLIDRLDKSDANKQSIYIEELQEILLYEFGIGMNLDATKAQTRVTCYWLFNWYEDEYFLGLRVYFLDDKLLATSCVTYPDDEDFSFVNADIRKELKAYILTFEKEQEYTNCMDLEVDMGEGYKLNNSSELIATHVMYKGKKCKVVGAYDKENKIRIEIDTEIVITVDISEVDICYNIV
jgi:hypothetical protein